MKLEEGGTRERRELIKERNLVFLVSLYSILEKGTGWIRIQGKIF